MAHRRRQLSSCATWSDDVFLRQGALVSLGQQMVTVCPQEKDGHLDWSMRLIPANRLLFFFFFSTSQAQTDRLVERVG